MALAYWHFSSIPKDEGILIPILIFVLSAIIAASEFAILGETINSGVATTFVCMAEEPRVLQQSKPELYEKVLQAYPSVQL